MTTAAPILKAPFPAFGGKSAIAPVVWSRLGNVRNYIEPFAFSAAMLLKRPHADPQIETINDLNSYVSNFWRAIQHDPEGTAAHADWPVNEADLHARHRWLVYSDQAAAALERVRTDPDFYDARIAGWWCWGACMWIGSGWCETQQLPHLDPTRGVLGERPDAKTWQQRPQLGLGVNGNNAISDCQRRRLWLVDWFKRLSDRLRPVRVCCGHWMRVCDSDSTLTRLGTTGVFLDPPYRKELADGTANRAAHLYANDKHQDVGALCDEVQDWCLRWGEHRDIRIVLCGLEGEYPKLHGWEQIAWKSRGGYGNRTQRGKDNAARERLWVSPHCLKGRKIATLFGEEVA